MSLLWILIILLIILFLYVKNKDIIFTLKSMFLRESVFVKGNHKIVLLGMVHIGEKEFYERIKNDHTYKDLLVLTEGIRSDNQKDKKTYKGLADIFGLTLQEKSLFEEGFDNVNADFHINDFSKETINFVTMLFQAFKGLDEKNVDLLISSLDEIKKEDKDKKKRIMKEILNKRNECLYAHIKNNQNRDLLVPWGAKHLKEIKSLLIQDGYKIKSTRIFKAIDIWKSIISVHSYYKNNKEFLNQVKERLKSKDSK